MFCLIQSNNNSNCEAITYLLTNQHNLWKLFSRILIKYKTLLFFLSQRQTFNVCNCHCNKNRTWIF